MVDIFLEKKCEVMIFDPLITQKQLLPKYVNLYSQVKEFRNLDAVLLLVPHNEFDNLGLQEFEEMGRNARNLTIYDLKGCLRERIPVSKNISYLCS